METTRLLLAAKVCSRSSPNNQHRKLNSLSVVLKSKLIQHINSAFQLKLPAEVMRLGDVRFKGKHKEHETTDTQRALFCWHMAMPT